MKQYIFAVLLLPGAVHGMVKRDQATRERQEVLVHYKQVLTAGRYTYGSHLEIYRDLIRRSSSLFKACPDQIICDGRDFRRVSLANQLSEWSKLIEVLKEFSSTIQVTEDDFDTQALHSKLCKAQVSLEAWIALFKTERPIDLTTFKGVMQKVWLQSEIHKNIAMHVQDSFERSQELSTRLPLAPIFNVLCSELPCVSAGK